MTATHTGKVEIKVKELDWDQHNLMPPGYRRWAASVLLMCYFIDQQDDGPFVVTLCGWGTAGFGPIGSFNKLADAKDRVQADLTARIRSALIEPAAS